MSGNCENFEVRECDCPGCNVCAMCPYGNRASADLAGWCWGSKDQYDGQQQMIRNMMGFVRDLMPPTLRQAMGTTPEERN